MPLIVAAIVRLLQMVWNVRGMDIVPVVNVSVTQTTMEVHARRSAVSVRVCCKAYCVLRAMLRMEHACAARTALNVGLARGVTCVNGDTGAFFATLRATARATEAV